MPEQENRMFTYYLKRILTDYRRPAKEPRTQPSTDVIFEKIPIKYEQLNSYLNMKKNNKALSILKSIYEDISSFSDAPNPKFIWDGTLFVLKLFHNKESALLEHSCELERLFGSVDFSMTNRLFKAVKEFKKHFENDPMYSKLSLENQEELDDYYEPKMLPSLYITENEIHALPKSSIEIKHFEQRMQRRIKKLKSEKNNTSNNISFTPCEPEQGNSKIWMLKLFKQHGCLKLDQHVDRLINLLHSDEDDVAIQGELVSFIGLENLSLAESLLKNRQKIISFKNKQLDKSKVCAKPAIGPQIVVQSKQEKTLAKKMLKLQKKKNNAFESNYMQERGEYEQIKNEYLKAKTTPLFKRSMTLSTTSYPNVYDGQNSKKFAQVQSKKMLDLLTEQAEYFE